MQISELDVLVVDDHEAMRTLLRKVLERAGVHRVRDASSGPAALAMISESAPTLILCDRRMPEMDGITFVRSAREMLSADACRIIMVSGHSGDAAHDEARAAGADALLVKPVSPRDLLAALNQLLA